MFIRSIVFSFVIASKAFWLFVCEAIMESAVSFRELIALTIVCVLSVALAEFGVE